MALLITPYQAPFVLDNGGWWSWNETTGRSAIDLACIQLIGPHSFTQYSRLLCLFLGLHQFRIYSSATKIHFVGMADYFNTQESCSYLILSVARPFGLSNLFFCPALTGS